MLLVAGHFRAPHLRIGVKKRGADDQQWAMAERYETMAMHWRRAVVADQQHFPMADLLSRIAGVDGAVNLIDVWEGALFLNFSSMHACIPLPGAHVNCPTLGSVWLSSCPDGNKLRVC